MKFTLNTTKLNTYLTLTLKTVGVITLLTASIVGTKVYNHNKHQSTATCEISSFDFWMKKNYANQKVEVVSISEDKIQLDNSLTSCTGFAMKNGSALKFKGWIADTSKGVVGNAWWD